jgi:hypothetical protein
MVVINVRVKVPEWVDRIFARPAVLYRKWKYGNAYRRIALTEGKFTLVDEDVYYRLNNYGWCAKTCFGHTYAIRFVDTPKRGSVMVSLHREIMNAPKGLLVDHKDRNTLDNRRENLRLATYAQNSCNCDSSIDKTKTSSRYIGVHLRKKSGKWVATIRINREKTWLGSYDNEIDAAKAYDTAARKHHGEFARLNFDESADSV